MKCDIFHVLDGAVIYLLDDEPFRVFTNDVTDSRSVVLQGNGASSRTLVGVGNYVAGGHDDFYGAQQHRRIAQHLVEIYPLAIGLFFIGTPSEQEFVESIQSLSLDWNKVDMYVYYGGSPLRISEDDQQSYRSFSVLQPDYPIECTARASFMKMAKQAGALYALMVDSDTVVDRETMVQELAQWNQTVVAGHAKREDEIWSNFWPDMGADGWHKSAFDEDELSNNERIGLWQVPFARSLLLIRSDAMLRMANFYESNANSGSDCSRRVCVNALDDGFAVYVDNRHVYATLLDTFGSR
jgi:hypothetical protein